VRSSEKIDTLQTIELAEGVHILLRAAGPGVRMLAWMIDMGWFALWMLGLGVLTALLGEFFGTKVGGGLYLLGFFLLNWFYFVFYEVRRGASPGKKSMGIKVVRTSGAPVGWGPSILRNLLRSVDLMPFGYLFGVSACLSNRYFQRLGDLVADTVVVYSRLDGMNDHITKFPGPVAHEAPGVVLNREEQQALVQFAERSLLWSTSRQQELIAHIEPLVGTGQEGVNRALSMGAWIRDS